jgi:hypothetical protein
MRKILVLFLLVMLILTSCSRQAGDTGNTKPSDPEVKETGETVKPGKNDIIPADVVIKVNDDDNHAVLKGLHLRVNTKEEEFFSHNYFVTMEDLENLAKERDVEFNYDKKNRKLKLGDREYEMVPLKVDQDSGYGKVKYYEKNRKTYVDTWDIYGGLGFSSISKTNNGVYFYDPDLEKKDTDDKDDKDDKEDKEDVKKT